MKYFDRIVVGTGGVGSAVCYHLAAAGASVVGLDAFAMAHDRGSSHGQTRIIRRAYFEHPDYVPLLNRAYELWDQLQHLTQWDLFVRQGLLEIGPPDGVVIPGIQSSVAAHGLSVESLSAQEARARFPGFHVPESCVAVYESDAGILRVEQCVAAYLTAAISRGAAYLPVSPVREIRAAPGRPVRVQTDDQTFEAEGVVVCGGAWASQLIDVPVPLRVTRKHMHWYRTRSTAYAVASGTPVFFYELPHGCFYGFPSFDGRSIKIAEHSGGEPVVDPGKVSKSLDREDAERTASFVRDFLPDASTERLAHQVCLYTRSPDDHFLVDRHADMPQLVYAAGLSGHGFKFASVLGELLAGMSLGVANDLAVEFLSARRFAPSDETGAAGTAL